MFTLSVNNLHCSTLCTVSIHVELFSAIPGMYKQGRTNTQIQVLDLDMGGTTCGPNISLVRPIALALFAIILALYSFGSFPDRAIRVQLPQPYLVRLFLTTLSISGVQLVTKRFARFFASFAILKPAADGREAAVPLRMGLSELLCGC